MGFNTVVLVLNDHIHELRKSPLTVAYAVTHPPMSDHEDTMKRWWIDLTHVADSHGENISALRGGLKVLPTYHASDCHVLLAGHNGLNRPDYKMVEVKEHRMSEKEVAKVMTIRLPDWWP